ncbi:ABC transporter permease [Alkalibacillus aidingensis]|uniref:ABC transporter permease n=1 Tax=Alkalibacillus aidingensis TaxID=2747607 RepID=UPI001660D2E5|nr:ABC transporter permease [Alkalibacillus aidingensis]
MKALFLLQWQRLRREPVLFFAMVLMTILFVAVVGGFGSISSIKVPTVIDDSVSESKKEFWLERLNETDGYSFEEMEELEAREKIAMGNKPFALLVMENNYQIWMLSESPELTMLEQVVRQVYMNENRLATVESVVDDDQFRSQVENRLSEPALSVTTEMVDNDNAAPTYNHQIQTLFGMTLFFSIYTIIFSLSKIAEEKRTGTMNRIILSPVKKWQVYFGHVSYSFVLGILQIILIVLLFKYLFNFDVGESTGALLVIIASFTFSVVAIGMLLLGFTKTQEQLNSVVPIVSVSMAMIGGAFWPIEAVSNQFILAASKVNPITYAMDALKGVSMYEQGLGELLEPIAIIVLIGVLCMGVGVNLIERRS